MYRRLITVALLLLVRPGWPAAPDLHAWRWQRAILPTVPAAEQCVVLDGELFARAAPGLRDLRVLQQDHEVPYALEESFDESAVGTPARDRAVYTTVLRIPLEAFHSAWPGTGEHLAPAYRGEAVLAAHVPIERILLEPGVHDAADKQGIPVQFSLAATPLTQPVAPYSVSHGSELISDLLAGATPVKVTAIGANLQNDATVSVTVFSDRFAAVSLQMRQRLLCVRPSFGSPLQMVFGNEQARPVRYDSMSYYHPQATPVLAQLGPVTPNPAYRGPVPHASLFHVKHAVLLTCAVLLAVAATATLLLLPTGARLGNALQRRRSATNPAGSSPPSQGSSVN